MDTLELDNNVALHEMIDTVREDAAVAATQQARRYVVGEQDEVTDPDQRAALGSRAEPAQQSNITAQAVREIAGRLIFRRFMVEGSDDASSTEDEVDESQARLQDFLAGFATRNRFPRHVRRWASQVMVDGNTAAMVTWDNNRKMPVITDEIWWDGETGMFVAVDATGETVWAAKEWQDAKRNKKRRTSYQTGLIRKFEQDGKGWEQIGEIETLREEGGKPLGVPVVLLTNTLHPYKPYGMSDVLAVIGNQNALNGALFDLNAASMLTGLQILTATGVSDEDDVSITPGTMLKAKNKDARFSAIPGGNIQYLIEHKRELIADISAQFPVPSYRIGAGDFPAGIALQRADGPMIAKVKDLGDLNAPSCVLLAHRATEMANVYGRAGLNEDLLLAVEWAPPDQVDPGTQVEIDREKADLYATVERLTPTMIRKLRLLSDPEVTKLLEEREAQRLATMRSFDRGDNDPVIPDDDNA